MSTQRRLAARQAEATSTRRQKSAPEEQPDIVANPKFDDQETATSTGLTTPSGTTLVISEPTTLVITPSIVTRTVTSTADLSDETSTTTWTREPSSSDAPSSTEAAATLTESSDSTFSASATSTGEEPSSTLTSVAPSSPTSEPSSSTLTTTESGIEASTATNTTQNESSTASDPISISATSTAEASASTTSSATDSATTSVSLEPSSSTIDSSVDSSQSSTTSVSTASSTPSASVSSSTELPSSSSEIIPISSESSTASATTESSSSTYSSQITSSTMGPTTSTVETESSSTNPASSSSAVATSASSAVSSSEVFSSSAALSSASETSAAATSEAPSRTTITFASATPTMAFSSLPTTRTTMPVFSSPSTEIKPVTTTTTLDPIQSSSLAVISSILSSVSRESVLSVSSVRSASEASVRSSISAANSHFDDAPTLPPTTVEALPSASITATITRSRGSTSDAGDGTASGGNGSGSSAGESSAEHFFSTIGKSPGSIALVVLVCIGLAALAVLLAWLLLRCRRRRREARGVRIGSEHGSPFWGNEGKDPEKGGPFADGNYGAARSLLDDDEDDDRVEPEDVWRRRVGRIASASEQGTDASSWTSMIGDHEFVSSDPAIDSASQRVSDMTFSSTGTAAQTFSYGTLGLAPPPALRPHPLRNSFVPTFSPSLYSRDGESMVTGNGSSPTSPPAPLLSYTLPSPPRTPNVGDRHMSPQTPQTVSSPRSPLSSGSPRTPLLQRSPDSSKSLRESLSQVMGAAAEYIGNMLHADNPAEADRYTSFSSPRKAPPTPIIIPPSPSREDQDDLEWQGARTSLMQADLSDDMDEDVTSPSFLGFAEAQRARGAVGTLQTAPSSDLLNIPPPQDTARDRALLAAASSRSGGGVDLLQLSEDTLDPFSDAAAESLAALQNPFSDEARVKEVESRRKDTPPPVYRQPLLSFLSPFGSKAGSSGDEAQSDSSSSTAKPPASTMARRGSLQLEGAIRRGSSGSIKSSIFSAAGALLGRRGSAATILGSDRRGSGATITPSRLRHGSNATVTAAGSAALMRRASMPASNSSSSGSSENASPAPVRRPTFVSQASWSSSSGDHADVDLSPTQQPRARMPLPANASPSLYPSTTMSVDNLLTTSPALSDAPTIDSLQYALPKRGASVPPRPVRRRTTSTSTFGTIQTSAESPIMSQQLVSELVETSGVARPSGALTLPTPLLFGSPSPSYVSTTSSDATVGSDSSRAKVEQTRKMSLKVEARRASQLLLERRRKSEGALPFAGSNEGIKGLFGVGSHMV
ncbi:hypothetical protein ACM66B_001661 [Microbotryomycetes sp. NB124-2]